MHTAFRCGSIALLGPTNAGKSSLLNALLREKIAIVTPKANTTRTQITGIYTNNAMQLIILDTPGFQTHKGLLQRSMTQAISTSSNTADVLLLVLDIHLYTQRPRFFTNDSPMLFEPLIHDSRPIIVVLNKVDLFSDKTKILPYMEKIHTILPHAELYPCSVKDKKSIQTLEQLIYTKLPQQEALYPAEQVSTLSTRFIVQEYIREQLLLQLSQEVPYASTVTIDHWDESTSTIRIHASIVVERASQKAIVIGKHGNTIKAIGVEARKNIETFLSCPIYLELWVKVEEDWREDVQSLHKFGLC